MKTGFLKTISSSFMDGVVKNNPVLIQLLGMCPTLAITTSVKNAIGMGLSATAVLICVNLIISLIRNFIPKDIRIAAYIVVIAGFVSALELVIHAYLPDIYNALGIFIPLIVVNCIIFARAEAFASKNKPFASLLDGLFMGIGFTLALILVSSIREIIGAGTFLGIPVFGEGYRPAMLFILPPGAFLTLGTVIACVQKVTNSITDKSKLKIRQEEEAA